MNDLICARLKEMVHLQDIIKTDEQHYNSAPGKVYNFSEYSLSIAFLRDIHQRYLSFKNANDEKSSFATKIRNLDEGKKQLKKSFS